ncbi:MAG: Mur ligase domain-containing protein, partial [Candidatus Acidiferrum sp.]
MSDIEEARNSNKKHADEGRTDSSSPRVSPRSMKLRELLQGTEASVSGAAEELEIRQVACDSRKVQPGALFFALHGAKEDGNKFIRDAVSRGAVAIASEEIAPAGMPASVAWIHVREARKALAVTAANFFGRPAKALQIVAVTGTNGKTTTTSLI